ncbi:hypothetical protein HLV38_02960 [Berryella wangjianweii]|uniref:tRNA nuclease CdiA C-terminal domain-containing protein n=1 Tax=Berryella wangjianweii TaxID=2734634 RepID=A0A6M8J0V3_9ACTN|nr:hypothetical protein [Berryella wangjianweii]QKF07197.1 hypothetical protein HLV38_02960 [Berryella wangjianweii]
MLVALRARADRCRDALGTPGDVARDWARLTDAERAAFAASGRGRIDGIPDEVLRGLGDRADGFGGYYFQRVVDEMATRDRMWLFDGTVPEPTYETPSVERSVTRDNPWEGRTGRRLAQHGIRPAFIQDYRWVTMDNGRKRKVGLPDLEGGVEIKTPTSSKNPHGAVKNYFGNCAGKEGLARVIIDNSESLFTDEEMEAAISDLLGDYDLPLVSCLGKSGELRNIRAKE